MPAGTFPFFPRSNERGRIEGVVLRCVRCRRKWPFPRSNERGRIEGALRFRTATPPGRTFRAPTSAAELKLADCLMMCLISPSFPRPAGRRLKRVSSFVISGCASWCSACAWRYRGSRIRICRCTARGRQSKRGDTRLCPLRDKTVINVEGESRRLLDDYRKLGARRLFCRRGDGTGR